MELTVKADDLSVSLDANQQEIQNKIADVLLAHGLWPTNRATRNRFAGELVKQGWNSEQIDMVAKSVFTLANDKRIACGEFVNICKDKQRLSDAISDLSKVKQPGKKWHPGEMDRIRSAQALQEQRVQWADVDMEDFVRCYMRDGHTKEVAIAMWQAKIGAKT
jgi:hypothetical protein